MNNCEIVLEGKTFESKMAACIYYNLKYDKVKHRINRGWTLEEAFELVERKPREYKGKEITLEGKTFKSMIEACRYYNMPYNTIINRMRDDWTLEEAFELVERESKLYKGEEITLEGKTFKSIIEACKYYNLQIERVRSRLNKLGWTPEEAFELVDRDDNNIPITVLDIEFESISAACRYYNITSTLVYNRLDSGWSVEEAFTTPVLTEKDGREIEIDGNTFISIAEACRYYDKSNEYNKIINRLRLGWTPEEAFELVLKNSRVYRSITLEGKTFNSVNDACKYYNLKTKLVSDRLNKLGWTLEEAFELVKRVKNKRNSIPITLEGKI